MKSTMLLLASCTLLWAQDRDTVKEAIDLIRKAQGKVTIDRDLPGQQVVGVDL